MIIFKKIAAPMRGCFYLYIVADSLHMQLHNRPFSLNGFQKGQVIPIIHEEVFGEDGGAAGVAEDVKVGFEVGVTIAVVLAEFVAGKVEGGGFIEAVGKAVACGLTTGGVGAPTAGVHPLGAVSGGIDVDGDEADIVGAELGAAFVGATHALRERDVVFIGDEEFGIVAAVLEVEGDGGGNLPIVEVFTEATVRRTLARGVEAVAVVKKDFHCLAD